MFFDFVSEQRFWNFCRMSFKNYEMTFDLAGNDDEHDASDNY